jgi:decaprenylphospho-beta-D-ribofuranose 2-oxidase
MLSGWGRTAPSPANVMRPRDRDELAAALSSPAAARHGVIARGAGRSYGDAAQNRGGLVLDTSALRWIGELDATRCTVRVGAGATLAELVGRLTPLGFMLPVTPGTKYVTTGGAVAADIHGKNHHRDGSFGHHVESLVLCTPSSRVLRLSEEENPELFGATLGGMGLTGVVAEATLRVEHLPSTELSADVDRADDLEDALAVMAEDRPGHRYAIAWVDMLGGEAGARRRGGAGLGRRGAPAFGRSVIVRSDFAPVDGAPVPAGASMASPREGLSPARLRPGRSSHPRGGPPGEWKAAPFRERPRLAVPRWFPGGVLSPAAVRAFNALRWRLTPRSARGLRMEMNGHFFPLDAVGQWNRLYGRGGFLQYQFVLPAGEEETLVRVAERLRAQRLPMYLVVLKRFGPGSRAPLSFPLGGFTLSIDIPAGAPNLRSALDRADELVAAAGGRVYLAKDSRLRADVLGAMYPQLDRLQELRAQVDPDGVLQSDMARRLGLCDAGGGRLE